MKPVFFLVGVVVLGGCAANERIVKVQVPTEVNCPQKHPTPIVLRNVAPVNLGTRGWLFTHDDYKAMSDNLDSIVRWMKESNAIRQYYEKCIEEHNKSGGTDAETDKK